MSLVFKTMCLVDEVSHIRKPRISELCSEAEGSHAQGQPGLERETLCGISQSQIKQNKDPRWPPGALVRARLCINAIVRESSQCEGS